MKDVLSTITCADNILIYGAGLNAEEAIFSFERLFPKKIIGIAVTNINDNIEKLHNYKIRSIDDYELEIDKEKTVVIVAMRPAFYDEVIANLKERGYSKYYLYGENNPFMTYIDSEVEKIISDNNTSREELFNQWKINWIKITTQQLLMEK